jgi:hypothetical protein
MARLRDKLIPIGRQITGKGGTTTPTITPLLPLQPPPPSSNELVVAEAYRTVLAREADPGGLSAWTGYLNSGNSKRDLLLNFFRSAEFKASVGSDPGTIITTFYRRLMSREPDAGGYAAWVGQLNSGMPSEVAFGGFIDSAEFAAKHPALVKQ